MFDGAFFLVREEADVEREADDGFLDSELLRIGCGWVGSD